MHPRRQVCREKASRTACGDLDHRAEPLNAMPRAKLSTVAGDKPVEK